MKLPKSARLHHRSLQEKLFLKGSGINEYPLKMMWLCFSEEELRANFRGSVPQLIGRVQILVSVPKKKRKRAVDRVLMRRRIREACRLGRSPLLDTLGGIPEVRTISLGFVYRSEQNLPYASVRKSVDRLMAKLSERLITKYSSQKNESQLAEENSGSAD